MTSGLGITRTGLNTVKDVTVSTAGQKESSSYMFPGDGEAAGPHFENY